MKIQWNKVTWYSWTLSAIIFLIVIPLLTFYFYDQYKEIADMNSSDMTVPFLSSATTSTPVSPINAQTNQVNPGTTSSSSSYVFVEKATPADCSEITTIPATSTPQKIIDDEYGIFAQSPDEITDNFTPLTKYQDDGIITSGQYVGWHRIAAQSTFETLQLGDQSTYDFFLATKDNKTYVLDTNTDDNAECQIEMGFFNRNKVVGVGPVPLDHPATITIGNFTLTRKIIDWDPIASTSPSLASSLAGFKFFGATPYPFSPPEPDISAIYTNAANQYVLSANDVLIQDQSGLTFYYDLEPTVSFSPPNLNAANSSSTVPLYDSYSYLFGGGCDVPPMILKNISTSSNDLIQLGTTTSGTVVYTLKEPNHDLNLAEYEERVTESADSGNWDDTPVPTFQQYVASNPILIVEDPWGRLLALGESQYPYAGPPDCGV